MTAGAAHKKYDNIILLTAKIFTRNARQTTDVTERGRALPLSLSLRQGNAQTARSMHVVLQLIGYGNKNVASGLALQALLPCWTV